MLPFWRSSGIVDRPRGRLARSCIGLAVTVSVVVGLVSPAGATWSVVVADTGSKEVGVGFAACLNPSILGEPEDPLIPMVFNPGIGGGIYIDTVDTAVDAEMFGLLSQGFSPEQILNNIIAVPSEARARGQYSVVTVDGASAVRSGSEIVGFEDQGSSYAIQGNGVESIAVPEIVEAVEKAMMDDRPVASVVVDGLLAGSEAGGDLRCGEQTALFAQVVVVGPDDTVDEPGYILTVVVDDDDGQNPVAILAAEHEKASAGLLDVGSAGGRGFLVYILAAVLGAIMIGSGVVIFRYGIGNRAARK